MPEASKVITNINQIRKLFVSIIINCKPSNINKLWEEHKASMSEDILDQERIKNNNPNLELNEYIINLTLYLIGNIFKQYDKNIFDYEGLPDIDFELLNKFDESCNYFEEESYDSEKTEVKIS